MRVALILALVSTGVASAAEPHAGLRPGEGSTYLFSVGPIVGARARMSVGRPIVKEGRRLVAVQGQAETVSLVSLVVPVNASYQLVVDEKTLMPVEITTTEKGLHDRRFHSLVTGRALALDVVTPQKTINQKRVLSRESRDPLSAYFAMRSHPLDDGEVLELDVLDGAAVWRATLRVAGREPLPPARPDDEGPRREGPAAIRIEGTLVRIDDLGRPWPRTAKRTISCWLSDDAVRAMLRASFDTELGRASLELTSYVPPARGRP